MPNILQDNAQNKEDYMEENEVHIMSYEVLELSTDLVLTTSANESKEGELCTIATTTVSIHHLESRMTQNQEGRMMRSCTYLLHRVSIFKCSHGHHLSQ
jgi:hypothetical protein